MKNKQIITVTGVLVLLILVGVFFAFYSSNSENLIGFEKPPISKSTGSQNSNKAQASNSKSILNNKTSSNRPYINNAKESDKVVDQTLHSSVNIDESVLGAKNEKIELHILVYDGEKNELLTDYEIESISSFYRNEGNMIKLKSDSNGEIVYMLSKSGPAYLQLVTKQYAVHSISINVFHGKNIYKAKLFKGGIVEVRAINKENKIIDNLVYNDFVLIKGHSYQIADAMPPVFDVTRGLYIISNVPLGSNQFSFNAKGYQESSSYNIWVNSKEKIYIEIKLQSQKPLYFDLQIKEQPEYILIKKNRKSSSYGKSILPEKINKNTNIKRNEFYEYLLNDSNVTSVTIYIDKYEKQNIKLNPHQDIYVIIPKKALELELIIRDEFEKPVIGAEIKYETQYENEVKSENQLLVNSLLESRGFNLGTSYNHSNLDLDYEAKQSAITNKEGKAKITTINNPKKINLEISHKEFNIFKVVWAHNENELNSKTIVLLKGKNISGIIKFGNKPVMGAKVYLLQKENQSNLTIMQSISDVDGMYHFNQVMFNEINKYYLKALHPEFGVALSSAITLSSETQLIGLNLNKEKSFTVKLFDNKGQPMRHQQIEAYWRNEHDPIYDQWFFFNFVTDENGEYEVFNLSKGMYEFQIIDDKLMLPNSYYDTSKGNANLYATQKDFEVRVEVITPKGNSYTGFISCNINTESTNPYHIPANWSISATLGEKGNFSWGDPVNHFFSSSQLRNIFFTFTVPGYSNIKLGPYETIESIPEKLKIELKEGNELFVKVVDVLDDKPIAYSIIKITHEKGISESLPVNYQGEILFSHLSDKVKISVNADNYVPFVKDVDVTKTKVLIVKLVKNGGIKGHLSGSNDKTISLVTLMPGNLSLIPDEKGNFEFFNVIPGEYTLGVKKNYLGDKQLHSIATSIFKVEMGKIAEINLDEL